MEDSKKTVMIIEDDRFVMDIYHTKLTQSGFAVVNAENGLEALKKLREEKQIPDLILLDIIMPYLGGLEVLEEVKKDERLKNIPVILLTNLSQKTEIDRGMALGAKDFLIKSHFTPSEVLEKIKTVLKEA
ncbi:MAG: response regulator [Candidatus Moranbacteria bacterium]|nr:response regulator [Candidatus Moranbacteria bacterium]